MDMVPRLHESKTTSVLDFKDHGFMNRLFSLSDGIRVRDLLTADLADGPFTWHMVWHGNRMQQEIGLFAMTVYNFISSVDAGIAAFSQFLRFNFRATAANLDDEGWENEGGVPVENTQVVVVPGGSSSSKGSGSGSGAGGGASSRKRLNTDATEGTSGSGAPKRQKGVKNSDVGDTVGVFSEQGADKLPTLEERIAVLEEILPTSAVTEQIIEQATRQVYGFVQTNIAYMLEAFKPHLEIHTKKCAESAQKDMRLYSQALIPKALSQFKEKLAKLKQSDEEQSAPVSSATVAHFQASALTELSDFVVTLLQAEMEKFVTKIGIPLNEEGVTDPSLEKPLVSVLANQVLEGVKEHLAESVSSAAALNQVLEEAKGYFSAALSNAAVTVQAINVSVVESIASRVTDAVMDRLRAAKDLNDGSSSAAVMVTEVTDPVVTKVTGGVLKAVTETSNTVVKVGEVILDSVQTNVHEALAVASKENAETYSTLIRLEKKVDALTARTDDMSILLKSVISQTQMMSALLANAAGGSFMAGISNPSPTTTAEQQQHQGGTSSSSGAGGSLTEAVTAAGGAAVASTSTLAASLPMSQLGVPSQPSSGTASAAARTHQERKFSLHSLFKTV